VAAAIAVGFVGVLLVLKPTPGLYSSAAPIGLASGALAGLAMVTLRKLAATEPPFRVVVHYGWICTSVSAIPALVHWQTPPVITIVQLAAAGGFATAGQFLLSKGYGQAPAAQVAPFTYTSVVFAAGYGWLFWRELPDWMTLAGTLLIAGAGVLATRNHALAALSR
jgi:drug/metabolite transporter (DMT)-like permease